MIYLYLFGTCFHFIYVFMIIVNNIVFIIISLFVNWQFHKAHPYCFALPSSGMSK